MYDVRRDISWLGTDKKRTEKKFEGEESKDRMDVGAWWPNKF